MDPGVFEALETECSRWEAATNSNRFAEDRFKQTASALRSIQAAAVSFKQLAPVAVAEVLTDMDLTLSGLQAAKYTDERMSTLLAALQQVVQQYLRVQTESALVLHADWSHVGSLLQGCLRVAATWQGLVNGIVSAAKPLSADLDLHTSLTRLQNMLDTRALHEEARLALRSAGVKADGPDVLPVEASHQILASALLPLVDVTKGLQSILDVSDKDWSSAVGASSQLFSSMDTMITTALRNLLRRSEATSHSNNRVIWAELARFPCLLKRQAVLLSLTPEREALLAHLVAEFELVSAEVTLKMEGGRKRGATWLQGTDKQLIVTDAILERRVSGPVSDITWACAQDAHVVTVTTSFSSVLSGLGGVNDFQEGSRELRVRLQQLASVALQQWTEAIETAIRTGRLSKVRLHLAR
jgi:hypothetical protein